MYNIYSKMVGDYCIDKGEEMVFGIKRGVNGRNLVQKGEGKLYESEKSY